MANKKISQLMDSADSVNANNDYFALAERQSPGQYTTTKITAGEVSEFVLNPVSATQISGLNKDVYLNNNNWVNSTAGQPPTYGFLMIRAEDGLLTTGSGIGTPVDGDNLGNHTATQALNLNNNDIINADDIRFYQSSQSIIAKGVGNDENLVVKAGNELTLKGTKHVLISGDALSVATTPISGDVIITGGNLEIDRANKLIVNEITTYGTNTAADTDPPVIHISGAAAFFASSPTDSDEIYWSNSNIQYIEHTSSSSPTINFNNVRNGQTLTLYIQNTNAATVTPTFTLQGNATVNFPAPIVSKIVFGADKDGSTSPPPLVGKKTNVYTFVNIQTGIFASAITGYVY